SFEPHRDCLKRANKPYQSSIQNQTLANRDEKTDALATIRSVFAAEAPSLTIGTKIKFLASENSLPFSPCGDDPTYSCAVLEKVATNTGSFKSLSRCSLRQKIDAF
ncbi:MAG: hypothetical protein ACXWC9_01630, partial [Pseudobdellovibrionaceae bacterium]